MGRTILFATLIFLPMAALRAETFDPNGCDFEIQFPGKPSYDTLYTPIVGKYVRAQLAVGEGSSGYLLRAECIPVTGQQYQIMASEKYLLTRATNYAKSNGIQHAEYTYANLDFARKVTIRGFKSIGKIPATFEIQMYLGHRSFLTLYAASASRIYPPAGAVRFFKSVREK